MLALRPYQAGDELRFTPRADLAAMFKAEGGQLPPGLRYALVDGDTVRGVGGFEEMRPGQFGAWALTAALRPREWLAAAALARREVELMKAVGGAYWLQALAAEWPGAGRLLERIGFHATRVSQTGRGRLYLFGSL